MNTYSKKVSCKDIAPLLVFYACGEVSENERQQIEAHLPNCKACSAQVAEEKEFQSALSTVPQSADELDSSGILLSRCRSELEEALDDLWAPPLQEHWQPFGWLRRWMALRPAWSGALLIFLGIVVGTQLVPWMQNGPKTSGQAMDVRAPQPLSPDQLSNMLVSGVSVSPSPGSDYPTVQLQLSAEQPMVLTGNADDSRMRQILTYMVQNGDRFDAGVRLDCLDALKAAARDQQVRNALLAAARKDQNPAVRMKAIEALRDAASEDDVRQVLLEALERDDNPGVRVEAVNLLVATLGHEAPEGGGPAPEAPALAPTPEPGTAPEEDASIARVVRVLEQLQHRDPNRYVRQRSAAALRQIGPREIQ